MPKQTGIQRQALSLCDRCQFTYPISQLTRQLGLLLCPPDLDNLDTMLRPRVIAELLSDGEESRNDRMWMQENEDDSLIF